MATANEALFKLLADAAGVAALVGSRIYPDLAPQASARPYVVYTRISNAPVAARLAGAATLRRPRYQIDAYADTGDGAEAVARAVLAALDGCVATPIAPGPTLKAKFENDQTEYEPETRLHRVALDFFVWVENET